MFGGGTKLVSMSWHQGKVVTKLSMYGIVAFMQDPDNSVLLYLEFNFMSHKCTFQRVMQRFNVDVF